MFRSIFACARIHTENGVSDGTVASKGNVTETNEQVRSNFQQMISAAVTNAQQQNAEYTTTRRRIGSGRIVDSGRDRMHPNSMDFRYMPKYWNNSEAGHRDTDTENMDAKSDEPEWANCGPIS